MFGDTETRQFGNWETIPRTLAVYSLSEQNLPSVFQTPIDMGGLSIGKRSVVETVGYYFHYPIN